MLAKHFTETRILSFIISPNVALFYSKKSYSYYYGKLLFKNHSILQLYLQKNCNYSTQINSAC